MYSTHNERKSIAAELFIRTLKRKRDQQAYVNCVKKRLFKCLDDIID